MNGQAHMILKEKITIESGHATPKVILDYENGQFEFSGRCMPENIHEFFTPVMKWFVAFAQHPKPNSVFKFQLDYFNTASSKIIMKILKIIKEINDQTIYVEWSYKEYDEDVKEVGEDFADLIGNDVIVLKMVED